MKPVVYFSTASTHCCFKWSSNIVAKTKLFPRCQDVGASALDTELRF